MPGSRGRREEQKTWLSQSLRHDQGDGGRDRQTDRHEEGKKKRKKIESEQCFKDKFLLKIDSQGLDLMGCWGW